jgi:hypothetical protein
VYLAELSGHPAPVNLNTHLNHRESWETPTVSTGGHRQADGSMTPKLDQQVKSWATPQQRDFKDPESLAKWTARAEEQKAKGVNLHLPLPSQVMHNEEMANWPTPEAYVVRGPIPTEFVDGKFVSLHGEVKYGAKIADAVRVMEAWATPQSRDAKGAEGRMIREGKLADLPSQTEVAPTGQWNRANGKLNPRWVETLMGLPVGWTMPSCASPVTIAPTNCACSETELCQQPQP